MLKRMNKPPGGRKSRSLGTSSRKRADAKLTFPKRASIRQIEEGELLMPRFSSNGLIPCVTQDARTGEVLMLGYMNREALSLTIQTCLAHYWSRSRSKLWHKGECSGQSQEVREILIDDDQDCVLIKVHLTGGASCHVGYRSCFFRKLDVPKASAPFRLRFLEHSKIYDPIKAYGEPGHE
jgi:phosphoribosyl-AMP cyclohydrolase